MQGERRHRPGVGWLRAMEQMQFLTQTPLVDGCRAGSPERGSRGKCEGSRWYCPGEDATHTSDIIWALLQPSQRLPAMDVSEISEFSLHLLQSLSFILWTSLTSCLELSGRGWRTDKSLSWSPCTILSDIHLFGKYVLKAFSGPPPF